MTDKGRKLSKIEKFYIENSELTPKRIAKDLNIDVSIVERHLKKKKNVLPQDELQPLQLQQTPQAPQPPPIKVKIASNNGVTVMTRQASEQADEAYKQNKSSYNVYNSPFVARCKPEDSEE